MSGPLGSAHVSPVIPVGDLARARQFYEERLGLTGSPSAGGGWVLSAGEGTLITLLPDDPTAGSAGSPVATFVVTDLRATVRALRDRGVPFLGADDVPFELDADGISTEDDEGLSVAWMRDPDGSVLTVYSVAQGE